MNVVGHQRAVQSLMRSLPPVTLVMGPQSVGRHTLAEEVLTLHGGGPGDVLRFPKLDVDEARSVQRFLSTRPTGKIKGVVADTDQASGDAMNALLKQMEEPPDFAHFMLIASRRPLLTVVSRAQTVILGYLTLEEVKAVLIGRCGMDVRQAERVSRLSGGQVQTALASADADAVKGPVVGLLKGIADRNPDLVQLNVNRFEDRQLRLLRRWSVEAQSGVWSAFTSAESFGLRHDTVAKMTKAMRVQARPKLVARLVAQSVMED